MAPDIPNQQYAEVRGMAHGHYKAALQGRPFLPLVSLASFQFAWF
jgi:hypothetical protein